MNDVRLAHQYVNKAQNCKEINRVFDLSFAEYKRLMSAKKCRYTGIVLTDKKPQKSLIATDRTLDRIDNTKGYITGNVVVCCNAANSLKSVWESGDNVLTERSVRNMMAVIEKLRK